MKGVEGVAILNAVPNRVNSGWPVGVALSDRADNPVIFARLFIWRVDQDEATTLWRWGQSQDRLIAVAIMVLNLRIFSQGVFERGKVLRVQFGGDIAVAGS